MGRCQGKNQVYNRTLWTGARNEVLLWTFNLDAIDPVAVLPLLSADERDRAARFRFDIHRERFIAARGALRIVLGELTGVTPQALEFAYGDHGKPALRPDRIHFNLSHSDHWAIVGATRAAPVGVDVERINADRANPAIARRFFARQEIADLECLPPSEYTNAFFQCWARKEAVLKAVGTGISGGLSSFAVPVGDMPDPVSLTEPACAIGNLAQAFPYLHAEGFASAVCLLQHRPLIRPVCDTVLRIPVRRTFK
jgi:4'-phosphopantetheinyl transferase